MGTRGRAALVPLAALGLIATACGGDDGSTGSGTTTSGETSVPAGPESVADEVEAWDVTTGWRAVPPAPTDAPSERWRVPVRVDDEGDYSIRGEVVVVADRTGGTAEVRRIDPSTGADTWQVEIPAAGPVDVAPDGSGTLVAVTEEQPDRTLALTVLDADDGRTLWHGDGLDEVITVEGLDDLIVVDELSGAFAVDRATGSERWRTEAGNIDVQNGSLLVSGRVQRASIGDPEMLTFGVLEPATGQALWEQPADLFSDAAIVGDTLVVTQDEDGPVDSAVAYDVTTGDERWRNEDLPPIGRATVDPLGDDAVLIRGGDSLEEGQWIAALELADGGVRWDAEVDGVTASLLVDGVAMVLTLSGGAFVLLDGAQGDALAEHREGTGGSVVVAGGALYGRSGSQRDALVIALDLPALSERWRVPVGTLGTIDTAVAGGFVVEGSDGDTLWLAGYL